MNTLPLHMNSFGRETSTQLQPSPAPLVTNTKRHIQAESPEFKERAGRLGVAEQHVLEYYAGDMTETRTIVLEMMESYRQQNDNQPPIVASGSGGANTEWICKLCSKRFSTFQRVATHLTSNEWSLSSWPCSVRLCGRTYKALDQLRRHMNISHSNASTEITTPPELAPSPQLPTLTTDDLSQLQPRPFTGPPDGHTQVANPFSTKYAGSGIQSTNRQWPQFQPQALSLFNQQPRQLFPPALIPPFSSDTPNSYHWSWPGTFGLVNTCPTNVPDVGQQFPSTGDTQHVQTHANSFPTNQYLPQSRLGSSFSLPSKTSEGFMKYPVPLTRSKSDSSLETEMHRQMSRAFLSSTRWGGQDYVGLGEDLLSRTQSFQQPPRDIPQFQPGAPPMVDQLVGLPTQPSTSQFSADEMPPLYQTGWPSTSSSMNLPPWNVTNAGQQVQPTRSTHYDPTAANYLSMNQHLSASTMDQGTGATYSRNKPAADTQFESNSSLASNDPSHFMDNPRSHNHSQGYYAQEGVAHAEPSLVNPPSLEEEWMPPFKFDEGFPDL